MSLPVWNWRFEPKKKMWERCLSFFFCLWCVLESTSKINRSFASSHPSSFRIFLVFDSLVSTLILFFFSSTKPFVIARNSSPMSSCLNCEGEGSVMTILWEPSMNLHRCFCFDCRIRLICDGIGSNLWWIDELSSGNFLGFYGVLDGFWKRLQFWSLKLEREWWSVFMMICHVMIDDFSVTGDVAFI